MGTLAEVCSRI